MCISLDSLNEDRHRHNWEVEYLPDPMSFGSVVESGDLCCSCGATKVNQ